MQIKLSGSVSRDAAQQGPSWSWLLTQDHLDDGGDLTASVTVATGEACSREEARSALEEALPAYDEAGEPVSYCWHDANTVEGT